jgi:hypothetical protein
VEGTLTVRNEGNLPAHANLTLRAPEGWLVRVERDVVSMQPGEERPLGLRVTVPVNATADRHSLTALALSGRDARYDITRAVRAANADLAVSEFELLPRGAVRDGGLVTVQVKVSNLGDAPAAAPLAVYVDDALLGFEDLPALEPGQEAVVNASFRAKQGEHVVLVALDPGRSVGESDEDNNARVKVLRVEGGGAFFAVPGPEPWWGVLLLAAAAWVRKRRVPR